MSNIITGGASDLVVKKTFFNHVFSTTDESKAEIMNVLQYAGLALIPVVVLNKIIQRFIPDADPDKSSLEIVFEILLQIVLIFTGIILIHRSITYFPAYSGFPYGNLLLTNSTLTFLIIILSIQTKMGIKVNILLDRVMEMWNGGSEPAPQRRRGGGAAPSHTESRADHLDNPTVQAGLMPPAPVSTTRGAQAPVQQFDMEPVAANSVFGGGGFSKF